CQHAKVARSKDLWYLQICKYQYLRNFVGVYVNITENERQYPVTKMLFRT
ncbi:MAG: hypothetical protein ACI9TP_000444, partial [Candidatus Azotimanducaceae bacterium]